VRGRQQFFWTEEEMNDRLITLMRHTFRNLLARPRSGGVDLRGTASMRGIGRIAKAKGRRETFP
jgi:glutamate dehydrogenase/leucine dehydrogenase